MLTMPIFLSTILCLCVMVNSVLGMEKGAESNQESNASLLRLLCGETWRYVEKNTCPGTRLGFYSEEEKRITNELLANEPEKLLAEKLKPFTDRGCETFSFLATMPTLGVEEFNTFYQTTHTIKNILNGMLELECERRRKLTPTPPNSTVQQFPVSPSTDALPAKPSTSPSNGTPSYFAQMKRYVVKSWYPGTRLGLFEAEEKKKTKKLFAIGYNNFSPDEFTQFVERGKDIFKCLHEMPTMKPEQFNVFYEISKELFEIVGTVLDSECKRRHELIPLSSKNQENDD